jgi:hypothetical protein
MLIGQVAGLAPFDEVNARLIAAAPDLLKACQALFSAAHLMQTASGQDPAAYQEMSEAWKAGKAAIAKATGGEG